MVRSAWFPLALVGIAVSGLLSGCVVSSGDGNNDGGLPDFGGNGGATTGGSTSGGTGGTAGAQSTGGASGAVSTGGQAGAGPAVECNRDSNSGTPGTCDTANTDLCVACLATKCCDFYKACTTTTPNDPCGSGGPNNNGEWTCMRACVANPQGYGADTTVIAGDADAFYYCGTAGCLTPICTAASTVADTTQSLVGCANPSNPADGCLTECFQ